MHKNTHTQIKATGLSVTLTDSLADYLGERAEARVVPWVWIGQEVWAVVAASSSLPIGLVNKKPTGSQTSDSQSVSSLFILEMSRQQITSKYAPAQTNQL